MKVWHRDHSLTRVWPLKLEEDSGVTIPGRRWEDARATEAWLIGAGARGHRVREIAGCPRLRTPPPSAAALRFSDLEPDTAAAAVRRAADTGSVHGHRSLPVPSSGSEERKAVTITGSKAVQGERPSGPGR